MKKFVAFALVTALLASTASAQEKVTLNVAAFPSLDVAIKAITPAWNKLHPNVTIKLVAQEIGDHHNAMTTALATGQGLPDVMAVEIGYVGKFSEGKGLEDLNKAPYNAGQYKKLFTPFTVAQATSADKRFVAMPTDIGPGTFLYRKDILDKAGVNPTTMMKSWEDYIAAGKTIKAKTGASLINSAAGVYGIVTRTNLKNGEGIYFDSKNNLLVGPDSPRFVRAFTLAKQVRDAGLDAKIGEWSNEWYDAFKKGTVATQFSGAWLTGALQSWMAPDTKGLWRVQNLPEGGYASWGGSFYAIPTASKNKQWAWEFIKFMTVDQGSQIKAFIDNGAFPALLSAQNDPIFNQGVPFLGGQKARVLWRDAARKTQPIDVNKYDSVADQILATELTNVLEQGKDIKQALTDARAQILRRAR
ncbi:sugar ABC transporter substrate-binding protein [Deinococcus radiopugnans]|uniref:Sugar ABC transporter substrate-binding protein n=2 Tax=Deinococcus radiopugnans TaxID=57497 RepID=A0A0A7KFT5_9DEIO|nr:extracellular solute-binding protein [Deinococcus radiopugnans]AIZ45052.1 sugar ABC transporter substrate-binding protein [Deinococcus radiopugnans]MBB6017665.1 multiple sugar transport system substrate-binding protein [Deinococcus radiopugnans ATCC 19172]QLG10770.1 extracellular solute-binding protein [Deinococcus sp. D7000]TNM69248.1 extracellular solute-binding protein [Deinococcus radiopugnans ATCC 19172]